MLTFLFWNLNRQRREDIAARLAERHQVDVLMLAECSTPEGAMLRALNRKRVEFHDNGSPGTPRGIAIYSRFAGDLIRPLYDDARLTVRHLRLPARHDMLLGVVHLRSKLYQREDSQAFACVELSRMLDELERKLGHRRTILAGDFNMNPFESGMVSAAGLNAVMD
ncbi:hypothetical protein BE04_41670 [Sorangium cellulosum]|nr:endonuclease/exonuclease/phosphatase family protein [Sorangium cellulosum]KYF57111.1 hypothetical protein BE04_41670 [Sorangium cellulosum]